MVDTLNLRCVLDARAMLGESPIWSVHDSALYWADIGSWPRQDSTPALHRYDPATKQERRWDLPRALGAFALCPGGALLALSDGLYDLSFDTGRLTAREAAPYDQSLTRFNEGKCDRRGRFWLGTAQRPDPKVTSSQGHLYVYDGRELQPRFDGIGAANGLAWSPDNRTMYFADSRALTVWAFDYDIDSGEASRRREFIKDEPGAILDGAAVDTEGGYWIAVYDRGEVRRYTPDGRLDRRIAMPLSKPTMVAFGGPGLATMYITTARHRMSAERLMQEPLAGGLFACEPGVCGLPEPTFQDRKRVA